jgi:hypothetical protein
MLETTATTASASAIGFRCLIVDVGLYLVSLVACAGRYRLRRESGVDEWSWRSLTIRITLEKELMWLLEWRCMHAPDATCSTIIRILGTRTEAKQIARVVNTAIEQIRRVTGNRQ